MHERHPRSISGRRVDRRRDPGVVHRPRPGPQRNVVTGAVTLAASGTEALEHFSTNGSWDLLITDVVMPGIGGRELVDRVRELKPGQRVLFISGYTEDAVLRKGIDGAEVDFLPKPFTPELLVDRVVAALRSHAR